MKKRISSLLLAALFVISLSASTMERVSSPIPIRPSIVDSHLHYQNFIQQSEGFEKLAQKMVDARVEGAVIFGMPMAKKWDETSPVKPAYYMSDDSRSYYFTATDYIMAMDLKNFKETHKELAAKVKFYPFMCGVDTNDLYAAEQLKKTYELFPDTFYGIGELMLRHDDLTALTYGEAPRPNSKGMQKIYDFAKTKELPVLIHHNISASYSQNADYLSELQEGIRYAKGKGVKVIWAHVGISRRVEIPNQKLLDLTASLLAENENLFIDISWLVADNYINSQDEDGKAYLPQWVEIIKKNPTRFMIGSDKVGSWNTYTQEIDRYNLLVETILGSDGNPTNKEIAEKLCSGNILALLNR